MKSKLIQHSLILTSVLFGLFCRVSNAEKCDVQSLPIAEIEGHNSQITLPSGQTLTVIGINHISSPLRAQGAKYFAQPPNDTLQTEVIDLLRQNLGPFTNQRSITDYLEAVLEQQPPPDYLAFETSPKALPQWLSAADLLYPKVLNQEKTSGFRQGLWDNLLLVTVEPALYIKLTEPTLLQKTEIKGFDFASAYVAGTAETQDQASPNAVAKEVRRKLSDNPRTRRAFDKLVRTFNPNSSKYRGWSDAKIRSSVLAHVWKPERQNIGRWVDAKMKARHASKKPATSWSFNIENLAAQIRGLNGSGIILVGSDLFKPAVNGLQEACKTL